MDEGRPMKEVTSKTQDSVDRRDLVVLAGELAAPKRRRIGERTSLMLTSLSVSWEEDRALSRLRERG